MATKKKMLQAAAGAGGDVGAWDLSYAYFDDPLAWDVSSASYSNKSFSVAGQETTPEGLFFKPDGTKMYIIGRVGDDVNEYDLITAWDVSSASYLQTFSVLSQDGFPKDIFFKPDGLKMYMVGGQGQDINEYDLSTAWDVSSAVFLQLFSVVGYDNSPTAVYFKPDGTKMYVVGFGLDRVSEYDLSTAWDVTTALYLQSFSIAGQETTPQGLFFKSDGTKMYVTGSTGDDVNEYDLSTAWDVSSSSFIQRFSVSAQELQPSGLYISPDGANLYIIGEGSDSIYQYSLGGFSVAAQDSTPNSIFFKPEGDKMYVLGRTGDRVYEYDLTTAFDTSTASYFQNESVFAQESNPDGLFFKPDGTKMYVSGYAGDDINEYDLSIAWDVRSSTFNSATGVEASQISGLFFKPDGTKIYFTDLIGSVVYEVELSTAWDVSTRSVSSKSFSVSAQETQPTEVFFKSDGTKMYITGYVGDDINEYDLSTAWDITSASFLQLFSIANQELAPSALFFKDDGTQMFIVGQSSDRVFTYSLGVQE